MNQTSYRLIVFYFSIFSFLILLSGVILFVKNIGLSPEAISIYYLGNEAKFQNPKSYFGILEHIYPHLAGMGIYIMVLLHFLIFTQDKKKLLKPAVLLFVTALLNLSSGLMTLYGFEFFIYIKGATFILFTVGALYMTLLVISHLIKTLINKT